MLTNLVLLTAGILIGAVLATTTWATIVRRRDQEITALKVGRAENFERLRGAEDREVAQRHRAAEWRRLAVEESARVHELTDRLLLVGKIPEIDDGSEPMSVAEADRLATERERQERELAHARNVMKGREFVGMEPVAVNDEEVPPVARLDDSDGEEDTSFASRIGHDG